MDSNPKTSPPSRELLLKLRRALESKEKADEANKLTQLSQVALNEWHDNKAAIDFLLQALAIQQQIDDKPAQIATLGNIAQLYQGWGENAKALEYSGQALALQQQTNDGAGAQATLDSMAKIEAASKGAAPATAAPPARPTPPPPVVEKPAAPPAPAPSVTKKPVEAKPAEPAPSARPVKVSAPPAGPAYVVFTFATGRKKLTPGYFQQAILPLVAAIGDLQQVMDEIQGKPTQELVISSISQDETIRVTLEGAEQASQLVQELIAPWRQENAGQMAQLDELQEQVDIGRIRTEMLEKRAVGTKNQAEAEKLTAEATRLQAEGERLRQGSEKIRLDLYRAKVELALEILSQVAGRLGEVERIRYMIKLLAPLEALGTSDLEIGVQ